MNIVLAIRVAAVMLPIAAMNAPAQLPGLAPGSRVLLHAHNCYPEDGRWTDRLDRALGTGRRPIVIEQDLAWARDASGAGRSVVSHDADLSGREPSLEEHFFARLRPIMTRALQENRRDTWPVVILHLDFKTNEPEHHEAVWRLLGTYEAWLTTAVRTVDPSVTSPLDAGPLLVLTEQGEGQELRFHARVAAGERLRLFGTVPGPALPDGDDRRARHAALVGTAADTLIPSGAPRIAGGSTSRGPRWNSAGSPRRPTGPARMPPGCGRWSIGPMPWGCGSASIRSMGTIRRVGRGGAQVTISARWRPREPGGAPRSSRE
jgi:hypothetical protein